MSMSAPKGDFSGGDDVPEREAAEWWLDFLEELDRDSGAGWLRRKVRRLRRRVFGIDLGWDPGEYLDPDRG